MSTIKAIHSTGCSRPGNAENGNGLIVAIFVSFVLSVLGMGLLVLTDIESKISDNFRDQTRALYLAQSGAEKVIYYFSSPEMFTDISGTYSGYTVAGTADAQQFFEPRMIVNDLPSYINTFGLSQYDDTNNDGTGDGHDHTNPVLLYNRDSSMQQESYLDSITPDMTEHSYIQELMVYAAPPGVNAVATIRVTARVEETERTVELLLMPVPEFSPGNPTFMDALSSGAGASWNGNPVLVHWGNVKIQNAPADIGNNISKVPSRTVDAPINGNSYPGASGEDRWLRIFTSVEYTGPSSPPSIFEATYQNPPANPGEQNAHQYASPRMNTFSNQIFTIAYWDYATAKAMAQQYGTYYTTDSSGNIYLDGTGSALDFKAVTNGRSVGMVFVDTMDGSPPRPDRSNLTTISFSGNYYTTGFFYIGANFATAGLGTGDTKTVRSPPILQGMRGTISAGSSSFTVTSGDTTGMVAGDIILIGTSSTIEELLIVSIDGMTSLTVVSTADVLPNAPGTTPAWYGHNNQDFIIHTTKDESTRVTVPNFDYNFSGALYCAGWVDMQGGPHFFGAIIAEYGYAGGGVPQVWYDYDLSKSDYDGYGIPNVTRGGWREIY